MISLCILGLNSCCKYKTYNRLNSHNIKTIIFLYSTKFVREKFMKYNKVIKTACILLAPLILFFILVLPYAWLNETI